MSHQHITVADVKSAAREFYKSGRLTAQHPDQEMRECKYVIGDCRCAVGATMTPETLAVITTNGLNGRGVVFVQDYESEVVTFGPGVEDIQQAHDFWCNSSRDHGEFHECTKLREQTFKEMIGLVA